LLANSGRRRATNWSVRTDPSEVVISTAVVIAKVKRGTGTPLVRHEHIEAEALGVREIHERGVGSDRVVVDESV